MLFVQMDFMTLEKQITDENDANIPWPAAVVFNITISSCHRYAFSSWLSQNLMYDCVFRKLLSSMEQRGWKKFNGAIKPLHGKCRADKLFKEIKWAMELFDYIMLLSILNTVTSFLNIDIVLDLSF